ncbi:MAG: hypothetical protein AB9M53_09555 [Leptothrix sp. (in: b-proteobacteria)]
MKSIICTLIPLLLSTSTHAEKILLTLGELEIFELSDSATEELSGCNCGFEYTQGNKKYWVTGWIEGSNRAVMNINGKKQILQVKYNNNNISRRPKKGDRFSFSLNGSAFSATFTGAISQTCWELTECEPIGYSGKFIFSTEKPRPSFRFRDGAAVNAMTITHIILHNTTGETIEIPHP